jgi:hypothetical protein
MTDTQCSEDRLRKRITDLNAKAYYILIALSFLYVYSSKSEAPLFRLQWAVTLTALVAVLPVQDYFESMFALRWIQSFKVIALAVALSFTLSWIWNPIIGYVLAPTFVLFWIWSMVRLRKSLFSRIEKRGNAE